MPYKVFSYQPKSGNVNATLGSYIYKTIDDTTIVNNPWLSGVSLIANGDVSDKGSLEVVLIYAHRNYFRHEKNYTLAEKVKRIHITMGYRWWLYKKLSVSAGLMSNYSLGDPEVVYNDYPVNETPDTSARDIADYGIDTAIQFHLWEANQWAIVTEARYTFLTNPKPYENSNNYGFTLGFRYLVQEGTGKSPSEQLKK